MIRNSWVFLSILVIICVARELSFRHNSLVGNLITFPMLILMLYLVRSIPYSARIIALSGSMLNWMAMLANGGRMPYVGNGLSDQFHDKISPASRLKVLCDVIRIGPNCSCSIGDMLIYIGLAIFLFHTFVVRPWRKYV
jgi:hypothetical protein